MKYVLLTLSIFLYSTLFSQQRLFKTYEDSVQLVQDANLVVANFVERVNKIKPVITQQPKAILNTKPYLIFYSSRANVINLPLWDQVMTAQKGFFNQLAGSESQGKTVFGLFFNGFYLPHEMGHALQTAIQKRDSSLYRNEYFANEVAILYWRAANRTKELEQCYRYAKQFVSQLKSPVPSGADEETYFNTHYNELGADPFKYGYFQFNQFIRIYEDASLGSFDDYIRKYLDK